MSDLTNTCYSYSELLNSLQSSEVHPALLRPGNTSDEPAVTAATERWPWTRI